ncbi:hypothetical protein G6F68_006985 [Rhizopus microsporus]|nr:hypothetical protein G6F67_002504 [Rhizopus microsporus]KAG1261044.1 hypothetical protein G6F68_006985 [Rhizopus microsporus]
MAQHHSSQKRPSLPDPELPPPIKVARPNTAKLLSSQAAAARTVSPLSSNQDFRYLHAPDQHCIPTSQLRFHLRQLHINTSRASDIHYPGHHLVALLVHDDYESELRSQLNMFASTVCEGSSFIYVKHSPTAAVLPSRLIGRVLYETDDIKQYLISQKISSIVYQALTSGSVLFSFSSKLFAKPYGAYYAIETHLGDADGFRNLIMEGFTYKNMLFRGFPSVDETHCNLVRVHLTLLYIPSKTTFLSDLLNSLRYYDEIYQVKQFLNDGLF